MNVMENTYDGDRAWRDALVDILHAGEPTSPRDQPTIELLHDQVALTIDMSRPVITSPARKLNYRFMCAEALWILSGDNHVEPLARFVKRMREFSDDGVTLAGAYGPSIVKQLPYVRDKLLADRDTRQATLTIWKPSPKPSRDIPCTIAMVFNIRNGLLHQHVFMRSSDAWLGVPYDVFSFACVGLRIACAYNQCTEFDPVAPGRLTITPVSSHVYDRDRAKVKRVLASPSPLPIGPVPIELIHDGDWATIERDLVRQREEEPSAVWKVVP